MKSLDADLVLVRRFASAFRVVPHGPLYFGAEFRGLP